MAGWLVQHLGYGVYGLIDAENPANAPTVSAAITVPNYDTFTRICQQQFNNTEEVRRLWDPQGGFEYVALATSGSDVSADVWSAIRITWQNNQKVRIQYKSPCSWTNVNQGWPT